MQFFLLKLLINNQQKQQPQTRREVDEVVHDG